MTDEYTTPEPVSISTPDTEVIAEPAQVAPVVLVTRSSEHTLAYNQETGAFE